MFNPPINLKFKKRHKFNLNVIDYRVNCLKFGQFGLRALESGYLSVNQIEATRKAIIKQIKKVGKLHIRIFPDLGITTKPAEVRMGKGKGAVSYWAAPIRVGRILFEVSGIPLDKAKEVLTFGAAKLPVKTRFICKY